MRSKQAKFKRSRRTPSQQREGSAYAYYLSHRLARAVDDVSQAYGIAKSTYVQQVLERDPAIQEQLMLYDQLEHDQERAG